MLRQDVVYITINQNDDGLPGNDDRFQQLQDYYNIVVMSAGGYGHVPIPLLKQPEMILPKIPVHNRTHLVSYVGSRTHAPYRMRGRMIRMIGPQHFYKGDEWRSVMQDSKFSLCPRGYGRTSFHVMETLQMGLIPIQVYLDGDMPWLPYENTILQNVSFATSLGGLGELISKLEEMPNSQIEQMEQEIQGLIEDYFTFDGVMVQMEKIKSNSQNSELVHSSIEFNLHFVFLQRR
jgi:hypothetical protein